MCLHRIPVVARRLAGLLQRGQALLDPRLDIVVEDVYQPQPLDSRIWQSKQRDEVIVYFRWRQSDTAHQTQRGTAGQ